MNKRCSHFLWLVFLLPSELKKPIGVANAFSTTPPPSRAIREGQFRTQKTQCGHALFSTPPPLSSLSDKDDSNFDNYMPDEINKMKDVIVSLSQESNDETRRARLKQIMEVGLAGPNGGPKRFVVLFERVLNTIGEEVQREAREKYSERADASAAESTTDESPDKDVLTENDGSGNPSEDSVLMEKSPEELRLWALVDMMVQSKTIIKKHKF